MGFPAQLATVLDVDPHFSHWERVQYTLVALPRRGGALVPRPGGPALSGSVQISPELQLLWQMQAVILHPLRDSNIARLARLEKWWECGARTCWLTPFARCAPFTAASLEAAAAQCLLPSQAGEQEQEGAPGISYTNHGHAPCCLLATGCKHLHTASLLSRDALLPLPLGTSREAKRWPAHWLRQMHPPGRPPP